MIDTIFYFLFTICYVVLFLLSIKLIRKSTLSFYMFFLPLVIAGLIYDNMIIAIGAFIGEGPVLTFLSMFRFWLHALFTPTLILFAYGVAKHSNIQWAKKTVVKICFVVSTIALISYEVIKTMSQRMEIIHEYGIVRYTLSGSSGPPIMVIIVALILLLVGISLFRHTRWSIMAIGVAIMIVGSAIPFSIPSTAVINLFELIFIFSLYLTHRYLLKREL
ncbi:hypothetical protein [Priestia endophytica]|uniref:hypothetical protein n=1 Tax=Priestia endophytica TaxID=135735 RepID=UPI002E1BD2C9|nr:hypothetical protein [Priestia endophytica]